MEFYAKVPRKLVDGWRESVQRLSGRRAIAFHYHDVDEWLTVVRGEITFFTLSDEPFQVEVGRSLHIPRGEVHRVEVGSHGVWYRMFVPIAEPMSANELTAVELDALRQNLKFPENEDGRIHSGL